MTGIAITWEQGDTKINLGTVDADQDGTFATTVTIPKDATAGDATINITDTDRPIAMKVSK